MDASSAVFNRQEGSGAAQILGSTINPMSVINYRRQQEAARQQQVEAAKADRDKRIAEMSEWAPDIAWEPFKNQVSQAAKQSYFDWMVSAQKSGANIDSIEFRSEARRRKDEINNLAAKSDHLKGVRDEVRKTYAEDKKGYFDIGYYDRKLNDLFMDENGNGRDIASINTQDARKLIDDPTGYNIHAIGRDFVKDLPERLIETYQKKADAIGQYFDKESFKSKLLVSDENGKLKFDEDGNPMIHLSPEVTRAAMQDPLIKNYVEHFSHGDPAKKQELLKQILTPHDAVEYKNTPSGIYSDRSGGYGARKQEELDNERVESIWMSVYNGDLSRLANAFRGKQGVSVRYSGKQFIPGVEMQPKDKILVEYQQPGKDPNSGKPNKPRVVEISIGTRKQQEEAERKLNELFDEGLPAKQQYGPEGYERARKNYLSNNQIDLGYGDNTEGEEWGF